ncbi:DUF930 domain-containing protein [Pararhizobium sp. O133]|uniref:DUF930 domain-containing protein n=1 Tax=Pararhizobium sp. O133 TaxID=3449278 RepID=UPI003F683B73
MNRLVCLALLTTATAGPAIAMDQSLVRQFEKLDPQTRLEQRCDTEAMWKINADKTSFKPDKVIAYTFGDPIVENDQIRAPGAVFRSKGEWYKLKYKCSAGPDHIEVLSFKYKIGDLIPREEWDAHYLYP